MWSVHLPGRQQHAVLPRVVLHVGMRARSEEQPAQRQVLAPDRLVQR